MNRNSDAGQKVNSLGLEALTYAMAGGIAGVYGAKIAEARPADAVFWGCLSLVGAYSSGKKFYSYLRLKRELVESEALQKTQDIEPVEEESPALEETVEKELLDRPRIMTPLLAGLSLGVLGCGHRVSVEPTLVKFMNLLGATGLACSAFYAVQWYLESRKTKH